jgi:hypothetical protein
MQVTLALIFCMIVNLIWSVKSIAHYRDDDIRSMAYTFIFGNLFSVMFSSILVLIHVTMPFVVFFETLAKLSWTLIITLLPIWAIDYYSLDWTAPMQGFFERA